jgi:hypothetical protein
MLVVKGGQALEEKLTHPTNLVVWGVTSPVELGMTVKAIVGAKCLEDCSLAGRQVVIHDSQGEQLTTGVLSEDAYSDTVSLQWTEVEFTAPTEAGTYTWEAILPADEQLAAEEPADKQPTDEQSVTEQPADQQPIDDEQPIDEQSVVEQPVDEQPVNEQMPSHAAASATFGFTVTEPNEHEVTITVVNQNDQTPLAGAHIMLRPYSGHTNSDGVFVVRVAKGDYKLYVNTIDYDDFMMPLVVDKDAVIRAEMEPTEYEMDYRGQLFEVQKNR